MIGEVARNQTRRTILTATTAQRAAAGNLSELIRAGVLLRAASIRKGMSGVCEHCPKRADYGDVSAALLAIEPKSVIPARPTAVIQRSLCETKCRNPACENGIPDANYVWLDAPVAIWVTQT